MVIATAIPPVFLIKSKPMQIHSDDLKKILSWVDNPFGFLVLHGKTGRGKSFGAAKILQRLHNKGFMDTAFCNFGELYQEYLAYFRGSSQNLFDMLKGYKILVLDDLGYQDPKDGFLDFIYTLLNYRSNHPQNPTIITTNLKAEELTRSMGPRIVSRLSSALKIEFVGDDLRAQK